MENRQRKFFNCIRNGNGRWGGNDDEASRAPRGSFLGYEFSRPACVDRLKIWQAECSEGDEALDFGRMGQASESIIVEFFDDTNGNWKELCVDVKKCLTRDIKVNLQMKIKN